MQKNYTPEDITMNRRFLEVLASLREPQNASGVIGMMDAGLVECSHAGQSATLRFPLQDWQRNLGGVMMGGIIATALDYSCGILLYILGDTEVPPPTVSLNVSFVKPVLSGDSLIVTARVSNIGRRIAHLTAEGRSENTGELLATAAAVFLSPHQLKKRPDGPQP